MTPSGPFMCSMIQSIDRQKSVGAKTQPCRTPDEVLKRSETVGPTLTRAPVLVWRSRMRRRRVSGTPIPLRASHRADLSTESKAAFKSTYATCRGRSNSWWSSISSLKARIASIVDRPAVKPDCSGRRHSMSRGERRLRSTCPRTLPGTESRDIGL